MDYEMIVLDIDDTLLLSNGAISEKTKEDIALAQEKGIKIVLASGRPTFGMKRLAKELNLEKYGGYVLSFNGSKIIECASDKELYSKNLSKLQMEKLYKIAIKHECFIHTYNENTILTNSDNPYTYVESEITGMDIKVCDDFIKELPEKCVKATLMQAPTHLKEVETLVKNEVGDMYMTITKPFFLEFMDKNVDKGASIKKLCEMINIDIKKTIAIGDSYNDVSMIENVGLGIAMGNAVDELKKKAKFITDTNDNEGISKAMRKYLNNIF